MHDALLAFQPHALLTVFANDQPLVPLQDRLFLLTALERPDLIEVGLSRPGDAQRPLHAFLETTFATRTMDEWVAWFADKDVCFAPVLDMKEAVTQPHALARGRSCATSGTAAPGQPDPLRVRTRARKLEGSGARRARRVDLRKGKRHAAIADRRHVSHLAGRRVNTVCATTRHTPSPRPPLAILRSRPAPGPRGRQLLDRMT